MGKNRVLVQILVMLGLVFAVGFYIGYKWQDWGEAWREAGFYPIEIYDKNDLVEEKHKAAFQKTIEFAKRNHKADKVYFFGLTERENGEISCWVDWDREFPNKSGSGRKQLNVTYDRFLDVAFYTFFVGR